MISKGFRFGMVLQLAVGPISLYVFKIAGSLGFLQALLAVAAVTIVDALFILLAILGCTAFLERGNNRFWLQIIGAVLMAFFGIATVLDVFDISILPGFSTNALTGAGPFISAFLLTAANPLTILFWAGVLTARLSEFSTNGKGRTGTPEMLLFGLGAVISTLVCMTIIAGIGGVSRSFLPTIAIAGLNLLVGLVLIAFAVKMALQSRNKAAGKQNEAA